MVKIKRNSLFYIISLLLFLLLLSPLNIKGETNRVFDDANLFKQEEIIELNRQAHIIIKEYDIDLIIVTTNDTKGKTSREYADTYFESNKLGLGKNLDGVLFLIDTDNGETYILTSGIGIKYFTDGRIEKLIAIVLPNVIENNDFFNASQAFLNGTKDYFNNGIPTNQSSQDESVDKNNSLTPLETMISLFGGFITSALFYFRTKSKYKMENLVKPVTFRNNSSINLITNDDILIDTVLTKRLITNSDNIKSNSNQSTTHKTSSGRVHGGGGGKF